MVTTSSQRYRSAFELFCKFVKFRFSVDVMKVGVGRMDVYLEAFVEACFKKFEGRRYQLCVNALQGVLLVCGYKFKHVLPSSRRCLTAWKRQVPTQSALPIPQHWVDVVAMLNILRGKVLLGLGLVVAFEGFLRVGELCRLRGSDILLPEDSVDSFHNCGLRIRVAKTGRNQFARISDPAVIVVLRYLKLITPPEGYCMGGATGKDFNAALKWGMTLLGVDCHFTMHSLRHGRATMGFLGGETAEAVRLLGRWASSKSMEIYLQAVTALLLTLDCPRSLRPLFNCGPHFRQCLLSHM